MDYNSTILAEQQNYLWSKLTILAEQQNYLWSKLSLSSSLPFCLKNPAPLHTPTETELQLGLRHQNVFSNLGKLSAKEKFVHIPVYRWLPALTFNTMGSSGQWLRQSPVMRPSRK